MSLFNYLILICCIIFIGRAILIAFKSIFNIK